MQMLGLLWFELQVAQQYFREILSQSQVAGKTRDLDSLSRAGTNCHASVEPVQLPPLRPHSQWQPERSRRPVGAQSQPVEVRNAAKTIYGNAHVTYGRDQRLSTEMVTASQDLSNARLCPGDSQHRPCQW
jgi:hypothetical protein